MKIQVDGHSKNPSHLQQYVFQNLKQLPKAFWKLWNSFCDCQQKYNPERHHAWCWSQKVTCFKDNPCYEKSTIVIVKRNIAQRTEGKKGQTRCSGVAKTHMLRFCPWSYA